MVLFIEISTKNSDIQVSKLKGLLIVYYKRDYS